MGEQDPGAKQPKYFPETQAILDRLSEDPTIAFECIHGGEPAVGIYQVPLGCVAFPGRETQALCPQHVHTDGSFEGMVPIVDLSIDAKWSEHIGEEPDYCIMKNPETGELALTDFASRLPA